MTDYGPRIEASVTFGIKEGAFRASWGDKEAELRTDVSAIGFGEKEGTVRIMCGASQDPQFGGGTGLDIHIEREEFEKLLVEAADTWDGVECSIDTEEKQHQDWRCSNCGTRPRLKHEDEPENPCRHCGCDEWYVDTDTDQEGQQ